MGTWTPWGRSDGSTRVARGITWYNTPGHGGYHVSARLNALIPEPLRLVNGRSGAGWYEEDCDWARVAVAFPGLFRADLDAAKHTLANWAPDAFEAHFGVVLTEEQSFVKRERTYGERTRSCHVVRAAWGDWWPTVPAGMVGVLARRESDGSERYALVPEPDYSAGHGYVVPDDDAVLQPWSGP